MKALATLSEILTLAGSQFKVYEMGRTITPMAPQQFYAIESATEPYPVPIANHARLALCFWSIQSPEIPYIWFLQFPVDEQGFLSLAARDQFLHQVIEALGQDLSRTPNEAQAQALAQNPAIYHPSAEKQAYFNARLKADLDLPASKYYEHAQAYLNGDLGWDSWQAVALQGLADVVARLDRESNSQRLARALPHLNETTLIALSQLLEHAPLDQQLMHQLVSLLHHCQSERPLLASLMLRAMASSPFKSLRQTLLTEQLQQSDDPQFFIAIAGRLWKDLSETGLNRLFFEKLASLNDSDLFCELFADLVAIPALREQVLARLRDPERSPQLAQAIGHLIHSANG
ncbi:DUF3549 family protein [Celerinatantimonas sp. YJH-8]|uniref:DUF3549 family protein n=1 Tax=Celerinatantimonas sp. YJH-8 TaxID=3228714 RepID=UPI0038BF3CAB